MVVDPAVAEPVIAEADRRGWRITQIWNTHWHPDHTGGNEAIKAATGCLITGPAAEFERIPTLDVQVRGGDTVRPVSYTHLDVYKRQGLYAGPEACNPLKRAA